MLHEFLNANREVLIERCRAKVALRPSPAAASFELEHGIPVFLEQLIEALRLEALTGARHASPRASGGKPVSKASRAALHGKELYLKGYTVDQVVHDYGDICQASTELAREKGVKVTVQEFHTFNRLLDNAIADAVFAYADQRESSAERDSSSLHARLGLLADDQRRLITTALAALDAVKLGNVGLMGATGTLLEDSLVQLRVLIDRSLPEIRLSSGMTNPHAR